MSKKVSIEEVTPGMVIDKDVTNLQGAILLRKGNEITERHISIFKTWGINTIFIAEAVNTADLGGRLPEDVAGEKILELQKTLDHKFSDVADDEIMLKIKESTFTHRSLQIKEKYNIK